LFDGAEWMGRELRVLEPLPTVTERSMLQCVREL